jgi:tetraacyldisaccharide 4'-kinase
VAGRLASTLAAAWQRRGALAWILAPLALIYAGVLALRRLAYRTGIMASTRLPVPVVVVGNLYVGGTGKTPLTIEIVRALAARGWSPGVVSRGYGGGAVAPRVLTPADAPADVGDEPLLLALATAAPVAVGAARVAAAQALLAAHPECNVLVADDGLQHLALARDVELAVVDARGLGNGWLLPAGPLRELPARLRTVDAIVLHGNADAPVVGPPSFRLTTQLRPAAYRLGARDETQTLAALAARQRASGLRIVAAAGIGVPQRFFAMLAGAGLRIVPLPLPDHHAFDAASFADVAAEVVLITEKDAVKCARIDALRADARLWVVPLAAHVDAALLDFIVARLPTKAHHGPPAA